MKDKIVLITLCIMAIVLCITISIAIHRGNTIETQQQRIDNLSANVEILLNRSKKDYADKIELAKRNEELEQEAQKDTSCFTWTTDISDSTIVKRLRQN